MSRRIPSEVVLSKETMFNLEQINSSGLKRFLVEVPTGQHLFKQNDRGNTMYIVVQGNVKLTHKVLQTETTIAILGPGEIVGEKVICVQGPYKRAFSAQAETDVKVLEMDSQSVRNLMAKLPDFSIKLFQVIIERLDRANQLLGIMRLSNPAERLVQYLLYSATQSDSGAKEINVTEAWVAEALNMKVETVKEIFAELEHDKILVRKEKTFILPDDNALQQYIPQIKEKLAA